MSRNGTRTLPVSLEAERDLLGSWLLSEEAWDETGGMLEADDFASPLHRSIFRACEQAVQMYGRADGTTTLEFLRRSGALSEMKPDYLSTLMGGVPSPRNAPTYARIVKENSVRRQIISGAQNLTAAAHGTDDVAAEVDSLVRLMHRQANPGLTPPRTAAEILASPPEMVDALTDPPLFVRKGTTVLASETKVGKTNLWLHFAWMLTEGRTLWTFIRPLQPVAVLLVELDLTESTIHRRMEYLKAELGWSNEALGRFNVWCTRFLQLDTKQGVARLRQVIQQTVPRPEFVIIDNYNAAISGDPDKTHESRKAFHALRELQDDLGVSFGLTYEMRKPPPGVKVKYSHHDLKGNNVVAYDADAVVMLRPTDESRRYLELKFPALRHVDEMDEDMVLERKGLTFQLQRVKDEGREALIEVLRERMQSGSSMTWRGCATTAREAGIRFSNDELSAAIKTVQGGAA